MSGPRNLFIEHGIADAIAARVVEQLAPLLRHAGGDGWITTREAADYLSMSVPALHRLTSAREVPFVQDAPGGKCWFKRSDLDLWRYR